MKKLFLFIGVLLLIACSKSDDNHDFKTPLPEPTQNGAVMFACYVDGKAYIAKGYEQVTCFYQWVNGGRQFVINGRYGDNAKIMTIGLGASYIELEVEKKYKLSNMAKDNLWGGCLFPYGDVDAKSSKTNSEYTGELTITKLDMENEIVSGTFWFDVKNPYTGERVEVREGRFDTHFSQ